MENVKEIPNQRQTAELVERYKNEVRFLMAYYYSRMLEVYGPFPLVTSLVDVTESGDVLQKARTLTMRLSIIWTMSLWNFPKYYLLLMTM